jgi:hypothetical protein
MPGFQQESIMAAESILKSKEKAKVWLVLQGVQSCEVGERSVGWRREFGNGRLHGLCVFCICVALTALEVERPSLFM